MIATILHRLFVAWLVWLAVQPTLEPIAAVSAEPFTISRSAFVPGRSAVLDVTLNNPLLNDTLKCEDGSDNGVRDELVYTNHHGVVVDSALSVQSICTNGLAIDVSCRSLLSESAPITLSLLIDVPDACPASGGLHMQVYHLRREHSCSSATREIIGQWNQVIPCQQVGEQNEE